MSRPPSLNTYRQTTIVVPALVALSSNILRACSVIRFVFILSTIIRLPFVVPRPQDLALSNGTVFDLSGELCRG